MHPETACRDAVTAAITVPSRRSSAVRVWSARRTSKVSPGPAPARACTNHVARLSAFTASGTVTACPDAASPSSSSASAAMACIWRAARSSTSPDGVGSTGLERVTSTRPTRVSSALMRWLTAEGVT